MSQQDIVIVAAARTAVGKFGGTLAKTPASELGAAVIQALLQRAQLGGGGLGERAAEFADRRAGGGDDDDVHGHS